MDDPILVRNVKTLSSLTRRSGRKSPKSIGSRITKLSRRAGCINTESCRTEPFSSTIVWDVVDSKECRVAGSVEQVGILLLLLLLFLLLLVVVASVAVVMVDFGDMVLVLEQWVVLELASRTSGGTRDDGDTPQRLVLALQNPTTESLVRSQ